MEIVKHQKESRSKRKENNFFFKRLKKVKPKALDNIIHSLHHEVFDKTACLECASCCKTTGPLFTDKDIERISKHLRIRPSVFTERYLRIDEDKDFVLKTVPCDFLDKDNHCSIYEFRPKACKEFPHTDRIKQYQLLALTQRNIDVCPAVSKIVEKLKERL